MRRVLALAVVTWVAACAARPAAPTLEPRVVPAPTDADARLVDLAAVAPAIRLDLRYATPDNFTGRTVYPVARCLLRAPVADALARVQARLAGRGLGLAVWDCYRPFSVQQRFWALVPDERYVARPVVQADVPVEGSRHNRGAAVDVTLVDAAGREIEMPTGFDDFSVRAHRDATTWTPAARRNAQLLEEAMTAEGFAPLPTEWWHYDGPEWQRYGLLDEPLQ